MSSPSNVIDLKERERADFGFARARDIAFDAVQVLWRRRQEEGMKQRELAGVIGRDPGWVSKNLRGPGNWTMRTMGELVEGMGGDLEITVTAKEDPLPSRPNYDAYIEYTERQLMNPETFTPASLTVKITIQTGDLTPVVINKS